MTTEALKNLHFPPDSLNARTDSYKHEGCQAVPGRKLTTSCNLTLTVLISAFTHPHNEDKCNPFHSKHFLNIEPKLPLTDELQMCSKSAQGHTFLKLANSLAAKCRLWDTKLSSSIPNGPRYGIVSGNCIQIVNNTTQQFPDHSKVHYSSFSQKNTPRLPMTGRLTLI